MTLHTPLFTAGASHEADELRRLVNATLDAGVPAASDFVVSPRGAGANMSVDVSAGDATVIGPSGHAYLVWSDAVENLSIDAPPPAGQSRIDLVQLTVTDDGSGSGGFTVNVKKGTSAASPSAPTVDANSLELARVTLTSSTSSITAGAIADRRAVGLPRPYWTATPATGSDGALVTLPGGKMAVRSGSTWVTHDPLGIPFISSSTSATFTRGVGSHTEILRRNLPANKTWRVVAYAMSTAKPAFSGSTLVNMTLRFGGTGLTTKVSMESGATVPNALDPRPLFVVHEATLTAAASMWVEIGVEVASNAAEFTNTAIVVQAFPG